MKISFDIQAYTVDIRDLGVNKYSYGENAFVKIDAIVKFRV